MAVVNGRINASAYSKSLLSSLPLLVPHTEIECMESVRFGLCGRGLWIVSVKKEMTRRSPTPPNYDLSLGGNEWSCYYCLTVVVSQRCSFLVMPELREKKYYQQSKGDI